MQLSDFLPRLDARERGRFVLAAAALVCIATSALVARAAGDVLFLSRLGSARLPRVYIAGALLTGLGAYVCARVAGRVSTASIGIGVAALLIVGNLGVYAALGTLPAPSATAAYLLADLVARLPVLLYWALAVEVFDAGESRRLFGLLGAAGTAACLPVGLLVGPIARRLGIASLLLATCALLAGFILAVRALDRLRPPEQLAGERRTLVPPSARSAGRLQRKGPFVAIAALAAVTVLVQTVVDYQFKSSFGAFASGADLAAIIAQLYAYTSVAALLLQLFAVSSILRWGGIPVALAAQPVALLATSIGVLHTGSPGWVYAAKAFDVTLSFSVTGTARQMLYRGIGSESRLQARALAEGVWQPLAIAAGGLLLGMSAGSLTVREAALVSLAGSLLWIPVARRAYSTYLAGVLASLRVGSFRADDEPFAPRDPAVKEYVLKTLATAPDDDVIDLVGVLPLLGDFYGASELRSALEREDPRVKVAILDYLDERCAPADVAKLRPLADHADPYVRWSVIRVAGICAASSDRGWLGERLTDVDPRVRAAAAAGLVGSGDPVLVDAGMRHLESAVASGSVEERLAAAQALADLRKRPTPLLLRLLSTDDERVLQATLEGCCRHPDPALLPGILPLLARRPLAATAADAAIAIGRPAFAPTEDFLETCEPDGRGPLVEKLAAALGRSGDVAALPLLERMLLLLSAEEQTPIYQAYAELVRRQRHPARLHAHLEALIADQARAATARLDAVRALGPSPATELARIVLTALVDRHLRHAFLLLDARIGGMDMMALHFAFARGSRESRSQAVEVLENVVPDRIKHPLLDVLARSGTECASDAQDPAAVVAAMFEEAASAWTTAAAVHTAARLGMSASCDPIRNLLAHTDPLVRETAVAALDRLEERSRFVEDCLPLVEDPDPIVRELASTLVGDGNAPHRASHADG